MSGSRMAPWGWLVAALGLGLVFGGIVGAFSGTAGDGSPMVGTVAGVVLLALLGLLAWISYVYWRGLDEAAREAHKWSWFWGGNASIAVLLAGLFVIVQNPGMTVPALVGGEATPATYLATGGVLVLLTQMTGYVLAWLFWWVWKSR